MLLNELQKQQERCETQDTDKNAEIAEPREQVKGDLAALEAQIAALTDRLEDQIASR